MKVMNKKRIKLNKKKLFYQIVHQQLLSLVHLVHNGGVHLKVLHQGIKIF